MPIALKRKPRDKPAPYAHKPGPKGPRTTETIKTSARPVNSKRNNLTLHDWLTVFAFVDSHPALGQAAVVEHFKSRANDALLFTQATLSRRLKNRAEFEARVESNPNALSSKRPRIVTHPEVDRALFLWLKHMEEKREVVNGPMLVEKRKRFENELKVPVEERLTSDGWVASFCKA
jgi:hypothetical protein